MTYPITLNAIRRHGPCKDGWEKLLKYLGKTTADDEPLLFSTILDSNGFDDAIWCLRALDNKQVLVELACRFAESVLPIFENRFPDDMRPRRAIEAARADDAADAAAEAADAADAVSAAYSAANAAYSAAYAANAVNTTNVAYAASAAAIAVTPIKRIQIMKELLG